ncbi:MAG: DUF2779 domain-containing protein [Sulfurimicrobium sp.]|nr:DUF2779 domain-containing protein [Sulfurimicrobium sp.]
MRDILNNTEAGPILVYNQEDECTQMRELARAFPDLAPALHAAIDRVVDLGPITCVNYYHPDMRGSCSLNAVLPTIDPKFSYDEMAVADSVMAQEAFFEMMQTETTPRRHEQLRQALLDYCALNTFAMVRLTQFFMEHQHASR